MITAADVMFVLSFENSDAGKAAERKCGTSGADPEQVRGCMATAREKIQDDALQFKQDAQHNWWWYVMQKRRDQLLVLHKVLIDFGEETDRSIVIKPKGKDQGMARWANVPGAVRIEVPNDYTIAIRDPQNGKLVYDAKLGLMAK
jgi:hypothetical protein